MIYNPSLMGYHVSKLPTNAAIRQTPKPGRSTAIKPEAQREIYMKLRARRSQHAYKIQLANSRSQLVVHNIKLIIAAIR